MRRAVVALTACCSLVLISGCGSSGTPSTVASSSPSRASASSVKLDTTPAYEPAPSSTTVRTGTVQVAYRDFSIRPDTLRVALGTTVRWTNDDSALHNVTSVSGSEHFASGPLAEGQSFQVKLSTPGLIHYQSTTQPATMNATIQVIG